jgi:hypothetical protein
MIWLCIKPDDLLTRLLTGALMMICLPGAYPPIAYHTKHLKLLVYTPLAR